MTLRSVIYVAIVAIFGALLGCDPTPSAESADDRSVSDGGLVNDDGSMPTSDAAVGEGDSDVFVNRSLNSVLPNRVPRTGETSIRLVGLGFSDDMVVNVGSLPCASLAIESETRATCVVPMLSTGFKDLIIRWTATGHVRELIDGIEIYEPVALTGIQPNRGHVSGGQLAWISGAGFTENARAFVGDQRAEIIRVVDNGQSIRIQIPPGDPGKATVRVENINGRAVIEDGFEYYEPLAVSEITPRVAGPEGAERVILRGVGLGETSEVFFGEVRAEVIASLLERQRLDVRIPPHNATGLVDVTVENLGQRVVVEDAFAFVGTAGGEARVDYAVPRRLPVNSFTTVYLGGLGFSQSLTAHLDGRGVECTVRNDYLAECLINGMSVGSQTLSIEDPTTGLAATVPLEFFVDVEVYAVTPDYGSQAGGTLIEIEGVGFTEETTFMLGEVPVDVMSVTSNLVVAMTGASQPGRVDLQAVGQEDTALLVGAFEYLNPILSLGGITGEEIAGNLNVTVVDAYTSEPLVDAQVVVQGLSTGGLWRDRTDDRGQVTFGDENLSLPVAVTAAYSGYYTETLNRVTAEDATLLMIPTTPPESESSSGEGSTEPPPVIRGSLEGLASLKKPDEEGVTVVAFIESTTIIDGFGMPFNPIAEPYLMYEDGPFELQVSPGEFAVVAVAGYVETAAIEAYENQQSSIEDLRKNIQPIQMGMVRHVMVDMGDERDNVDVRLTIPMRTATRVEFDNPPGGGNGPNRFTLDVVLNMQSDGFYDLRFFQSRTTPTFDFGTLPDLVLMPGIEFAWTGEAVKAPVFSLGGTGANADLQTRSTSWMTTDRNLEYVIISPFVSTLELGARPLRTTGAVEITWDAHMGYSGRQAEVADCHFVILYKDYNPVWISVVPGAATELELPRLLAGEGVDDVISSTDVLHVYLESYLFSGDFSYSDFSLYDVLGMGSFDSVSVLFSEL